MTIQNELDIDIRNLLAWIPEIRNESFDSVSPIIYFQEQPAAV